MASRKPLSKILNGVTRFGRLTVLGDAPNKIAASGFEARCALVRCDCGNDKTVRACCLARGDTHSCGCLQRELLAKTSRDRKRTHGESRRETRTTEFVIWTGMHQRCYRETSKDYHRYGGRGIKICDRWRGSDGYSNFLADMGRRPSNRHSIDRIDNNGNYEPSNCRWATASEQARNRRPFMIYPRNWEGERVGDWQRIESAPKDGTEIISWDGVTRTTVAWYKNPAGYSRPGYWRLVHAGDHAEDDEVEPTHWLPLQAPPANEPTAE